MAWTNPNLLYFDRIHVIAPDGDRKRLFDGPTRALMDYNLVCPINPERYAFGDEESDMRVISHLIGLSSAHHKIQGIARSHVEKI